MSEMPQTPVAKQTSNRLSRDRNQCRGEVLIPDSAAESNTGELVSLDSAQGPAPDVHHWNFWKAPPGFQAQWGWGSTPSLCQSSPG